MASWEATPFYRGKHAALAAGTQCGSLVRTGSGKTAFWFPLAVLTSFVIPLVSQFLVVMGAIEMVTDQRKLRKR